MAIIQNAMAQNYSLQAGGDGRGTGSAVGVWDVLANTAYPFEAEHLTGKLEFDAPVHRNHTEDQ